MAAIGENTGRLSEVLEKAAEYYSKEVERALASMIDLIQPIMIIILGILLLDRSYIKH